MALHQINTDQLNEQLTHLNASISKGEYVRDSRLQDLAKVSCYSYFDNKEQRYRSVYVIKVLASGQHHIGSGREVWGFVDDLLEAREAQIKEAHPDANS